jgi:uncharacterized membrane protein YidH (DUF202 family)
MSDHQAPRDPGLQAERTALAWSRTAAALLMNAFLVLRSGLAGQRSSLVAVGFALLLAAGLVYVFGAWRRQELLADQGAAAPGARLIGSCAASALAACAAGLASIALV